jgi:FtsH-binding integral membrane protein
MVIDDWYSDAEKENQMLWGIALMLIILWLLGLVTGFTMDSFIHILMVAAVALLLVSLIQEIMINRRLRHALHSRGSKSECSPFTEGGQA